MFNTSNHDGLGLSWGNKKIQSMYYCLNLQLIEPSEWRKIGFELMRGFDLCKLCLEYTLS